MIRLALPPKPVSVKIAPPRAAPPSPPLWAPKQSSPNAFPALPPVAPARWNVELVIVTLPRLYRPPPSAPPPFPLELPPAPELPPLAPVLSNVVLLIVTAVPPPTHSPPP